MSKSISQACTPHLAPKAPRGGKGADKRFAAYDAECARIASLYCGVSTYSIARVTSIESRTAAVSVFSGERCLGVIGWPTVSRHMTGEQLRDTFTQAC